MAGPVEIAEDERLTTEEIEALENRWREARG